MAGISSAIAAAQSGATVQLVEHLPYLGGNVSESFHHPFDVPLSTNNPFYRETGICEEILQCLREENTEGTYTGQARALYSLLSRYNEISISLGYHCLETVLNSSLNRIESCLLVNLDRGEKILHRSEYFIDCSEFAELAQVAKAPGEFHSSFNPEDKVSLKRKKQHLLFEIETSDHPLEFRCPDWIQAKWEDNALPAQISLMESLQENLLGVHRLEWIGENESFNTEDEICWIAWDYIKNRSPLKESAKNLFVQKISPLNLPNFSYRGIGEYTLSEADLTMGTSFDDSVAISRAPISPPHSSSFSSQEKIVLPNFFEIPLRSLFSSKIKNLFWAGNHISCDEFTSNCLSHPPTQSVMGAAVGFCATWCMKQNRLPHTLAKKGHIENLHQELRQRNHPFGKSPLSDEANLIRCGHIHASTTWGLNDLGHLPRFKGKPTRKCLLQLPILSDQVDRIRILMDCPELQDLDLRLLEGSQKNYHIPGPCIEVSSVRTEKSGNQWIEVKLDAEIRNPGWHFIEIQSPQEFIILEGKHAPVGHLILYPRNSISDAPASNPYCEYAVPINYSPTPHRCAIVEIFPPQKIYDVEHMKSEHSRPSREPDLWISQPTDFAYPEFIEVNWDQSVNISRIDLFFDPSFGYQTPAAPSSASIASPLSLIKDYNLYYTSNTGKSTLIKQVTNNRSSHRFHLFDLANVRSLEVEIISTHGLNRAQVFKIAAYE